MASHLQKYDVGGAPIPATAAGMARALGVKAALAVRHDKPESHERARSQTLPGAVNVARKSRQSFADMFGFDLGEDGMAAPRQKQKAAGASPLRVDPAIQAMPQLTGQGDAQAQMADAAGVGVQAGPQAPPPPGVLPIRGSADPLSPAVARTRTWPRNLTV